MIKRIFLISFLLGFAAAILPSCKKGEGDPALSLRTRKARLTGTWHIQSGEAHMNYRVDKINMVQETYRFDGNSKYTRTIAAYGKYTGSYYLNLTIKKDGTFYLKESRAGTTLEMEGSWIFTTGVGDEKKKQNVMFVADKVLEGSTYSGWNLFCRNSTEFIYSVETLKNDELVIHSKGRVYMNEDGTYTDYSTRYNMIQKK